ncbi:MAG: hypothetical protein J5789_07625, partial [Oscillospiraceae bacterium]|nr:hypothetical protein [Oscillospiraceae bacterium]
TAMTTGQAILHGLGAKIAAGVLCAALIGGGIWAGGRALENRNNGTGDWRPTETRMAVPVETEVPVVTEPAVTRSGKPGSPVDPETEAEIRALLDDGRPISPEMGHYVRALSCEYEKPTDVDLNRLFADFTGILSDGERAALRKLRVNEEDYAWDSDREWAKVPSAELNAVLTELFGMDRSDFAAVRETTDAELLGGVWTYLPEFDCYYAFHTSTGLRSIQIEELLRTDDGRIFVNYVYQDESGEKMTAVLRAVDGHYQILANLPRDAALSDPDAIGTEPTDPAEPEPTEEELAAMERELTGEYFVKLPVAERSYFSNGKTRIWDDNGTIMKKDLASGETEALFTLETEAGNVIMPVGVTEDRLYIGWNSAERYAIGGELAVYSVDYQNRDKKLITAEATEEYARGEMQVQFENGYLVLQAYRSDVGTRHTCAIDRNDKLIMEIHTCWDAKPVDGSFYYIYAPDWENYTWGDLTWGDLSVAEQDELMANMRYDVCRIDPDGDLTVLGSITMMYWAAYFWIDADAKEIVFNEHIQTWDLFTVQPTTLETLAFDGLDPDTPIGVGISALRNDAQAIVFYTYFGVFGFDGTTGEPLFAVDYDKAFYGKGRSHTGCRISEDGTQLLLSYCENEEAEPSEYCLIDLKAGSYHRSSAEPEGKFLDREASGAFLPCREESESISGLCISLNDEDFYPFREN